MHWYLAAGHCSGFLLDDWIGISHTSWSVGQRAWVLLRYLLAPSSAAQMSLGVSPPLKPMRTYKTFEVPLRYRRTFPPHPSVRSSLYPTLQLLAPVLAHIPFVSFFFLRFFIDLNLCSAVPITAQRIITLPVSHRNSPAKKATTFL